MAALVQSFPSPTSTLTMLQPRSPAAETFPTGPPSQPHQRSSQMPRTIYHSSMGGMTTGSYLGHNVMAPVAPYAFTSTPVLPNTANPLRQHPTSPLLRHENRTSSAPTIPLTQQYFALDLQTQSRSRPPTSMVTSPPLDLSNMAPLPQKSGSKDDNSISTSNAKQNPVRPLSAMELNPPPLATVPAQSEAARPLPERYRRNHRRTEKSGQPAAANTTTQGGSALPSGSGMTTVGHLYTNPLQSSSTPSLVSYPAFRGSQPPHAMNEGRPPLRLTSVDDMNLPKQSMTEQAKRYRRKSLSSVEVMDHPSLETSLHTTPHPRPTAAQLPHAIIPERRDTFNPPPLQRQPSHARHDSNGSSTSSRSTSRPPSSQREAPLMTAPTPTALQATPFAKHEAKLITIPHRGSSDGNRRVANPSPLSRPMVMSPEKNSPIDSLAASQSFEPLATSSAPGNIPNAGVPESPAAQHLAALNKKDVKKEGKPSRLRRAFSFGSAAELRKASAENNMNNNLSLERAKLRKDRYHNEQEAIEAQQAAIAQKQEAAGLGEGIYSGQGHFFTGSTDNLSISSTASSASIMIRKMGKGMKKGSRSLVGLFRPKSVVGAPAADSPVPEPTVAQVSMVTVEAEREKVNVSANPHNQVGGGTGFPKPERNSTEAGSIAAESITTVPEYVEMPRLRRSIVGGEKERAEVLAAVKKGILKRTGTDSGNSSPVTRPVDHKTADFSVPQLPSFIESPSTTAVSTPADEQPRLGHRRTDSVTIEGEDYFLSLAKYANGGSKSMPGTPRSLAARNITFSPTIQLHDTWGCLEYDRRGDIATCNRLTPMLAQQIKEELNTFKMEMEVHEMSKVYTHFF